MKRKNNIPQKVQIDLHIMKNKERNMANIRGMEEEETLVGKEPKVKNMIFKKVQEAMDGEEKRMTSQVHLELKTILLPSTKTAITKQSKQIAQT
jgi:hypothetical protein